MNEVKLKIYSDNDMNYNISQLKRYGYSKTNDCMWVKIFKKGNSVVILEKTY